MTLGTPRKLQVFSLIKTDPIFAAKSSVLFSVHRVQTADGWVYYVSTKTLSQGLFAGSLEDPVSVSVS
jgi:hypothetical protein